MYSFRRTLVKSRAIIDAYLTNANVNKTTVIKHWVTPNHFVQHGKQQFYQRKSTGRVHLPYLQILYLSKLAYSLKFICNSQINTCSAFMVIARDVQSGEKLKPHTMQVPKVKQGDTAFLIM